MLDQGGCSLKGEGGDLKIIKGTVELMKEFRKNGLFSISR